jgi:hypothetical protein
MSYTAEDRRRAENEVIFRRHNERIQKGIDEIKRLAAEDDQEHLIPVNDDLLLRFYCECSDENCRLRIVLKASIYNRIHKKRNHFVIVGGHETQHIERIVEEHDSYFIVEKSIVPRIPVGGLKALNGTNLKNV